MANLLAVNDNCKLRKDYRQHVGKVYGAEAWQLDFSDKDSETRINKWVSEKTNGMIGGLAVPLSCNEMMRACNTLYFKGCWSYPFKDFNGKDMTTIKTFTQADGKRVLVNMMQRQKYFRYTHNDTLQVVSLPYENRSRDTLHQRNFSMYVFLPRQGKTLDDVVKYLHSHSLAELTKTMNQQDVDVRLPRFTSGVTLDLKSVMRSLGVRHLDDFSGISSNYMELSGVMQQAKIIVNEQGTEAAALTEAISIGSWAQPHYVAIFNANHPFIYMIVCDDTNTIYFMGEYTKGMVQENGEWMVKESTLSEEKEDTEENLREWDDAGCEVLKAKEVIATESIRPNPKKVFDVVEQMPSFPGGMKAMMDYLARNIRYPADAKKNLLEGRVILQFIVDEKGRLSDVKVARSVEPSLDAEAVRVVKAMPRWNPGTQQGKAVKVRYTLPVTFRLN
jgi:TonB family protein